MQKRYIVVPEDAEIFEIDGTPLPSHPTISFEAFSIGGRGSRVFEPCFGTPRPDQLGGGWQFDQAATMAFKQVVETLRGCKPGQVKVLDEDDWARLERAVRGGNYAPEVAMWASSLMFAVNNATSMPPEIATAPK